jgi:Secretion system C-terminal sorting domain
MKKFLLSIAITAAVFSGKAQVVLNEFYFNPASGESEFAELYNQSQAAINLDCYRLVAYYDDINGKQGFFVIDLPNISVASRKVFVVSNLLPFTYQSGTYTPPSNDSAVHWNPAGAVGTGLGTTGYVKNYEYNGVNYTDASVPDLNDLFRTLSGSPKYAIMLFEGSVLRNALVVNEPASVFPAFIKSLPNLTVAASTTGCAGAVLSFSAINNNNSEYITASIGSANGAYRKKDGICGQWVKSSASVNHTPGKNNTSTDPASSTLTLGFNIDCNSPRTVTYNVVSGPVDAFPVTLQVWGDANKNGSIDGLETSFGTNIENVVGDGPFQTPLQFNNQKVILTAQTPQGCYDRVEVVPNGCQLLPVSFKSFTATRTNRTNVIVKWETATEQNAAGFAVERNVKGSWEYVTYVPTQAQGGNSTSVLSYQVNDLNATKGISQYRIRQIDMDAVEKLSEIRSVRGEGQAATTIVYPNPSTDGRTNVVFQGEFAKRDVTVQDMSGRIIKQWRNYTNNNIQIDNLTPGFYTIRILNTETGEQNVEKLVVNNR